MEFKNKVRLCIGIGICALLVGAFSLYYQRTHFNPHTSINGINVGGLTSKEALVRLQKSSIDKKIYYHQKLIFEKNNVKMGITKADQAKINSILKKQFKVFNVYAVQNFTLSPKNPTIDKREMDKVVLDFVKKENLTKTHSKDAYALLKNGQVSIVPSKKGSALDENKMIAQANLKAGIPVVNLKTIKESPLLANSKEVALQKAKLKELNKRLISYKVQNTTYHFSAKQIIKEATFIDNKYQIDASKIDNKLDQINHQKATLDKSYSFRTPDDKMITVKNESYGWALDKNKVHQTLINALIDNKKEVSAKNNLTGKGYSQDGTGYDFHVHHGLGKNYIAVSIKNQRAWVYRNNKIVKVADVVTGTHSTNSDTPKGVFYIMYKQQHVTLRGKRTNGQEYASPVDYWAPFTVDGCGFHDASWRTKWDKKQYLTSGSLGCVNLQSKDAGDIYNNIDQHEPVVIF